MLSEKHMKLWVSPASDRKIRVGETLQLALPPALMLLASPEMPISGTITDTGEPINGPVSDRSLIFQQPSFYPWLSTIDNVAVGLMLKGVGRKVRRQVGLREVAHQYPPRALRRCTNVPLSPVPCALAPPSCSWMNPSPPSMCTRAARCHAFCSASGRVRGRSSCSSRTTSMRRCVWPTG